jgi:hypothetical protein
MRLDIFILPKARRSQAMIDDKFSDVRPIQDELHSDLEDFLFEDGLIDHELLRVSVTDRNRVVSVNAMYLAKVAHSDQALREGDWNSYIWLRERPYRLGAFVDIMNKRSDQSYWELLAEVWIDCENVWQDLSRWKYLWNNGRSGKQFAMSVAEREVLALLPNKLIIYRGCHHCNVEGLSWTLDREKAIWFARRFQGELLITATVNKQDVHAIRNDREEQEVIAERVLVMSRDKILQTDKSHELGD